ncbi:cytochrome P450 [Russula vinacea]|nr:cytochrome P450 [Russula vinacea]
MVHSAGAVGAPLGSLPHAFLSQLLTPSVGLIVTLVVILVAQDRGWMFEGECKQKFEHIMYLNAFGQPIIVLHSLKAAFELFDRRANIYSDRPRFVVGQDILCGGLFTALMSYGETLLASHSPRRTGDTHKGSSLRLSSSIFQRGDPPFYGNAQNPDASDKHIQRSSASATMSILYDYPTLEDEQDKNLLGIYAFVDRMSAAVVPGAYLVELFHWMVHIPARFAKWKREGMERFEQHSAMFNGLLDTVSNDIVSRYLPYPPNILESLSFQAKGSERPSVSASLLKGSNRNGLSNTEISWLLGGLYTAGAETTATTMTWWTRAMIAHPEIQKRAQDELDAVVGRSRTPTFADAPNLPYIQALVKESLRWRAAFPFSIPRNTTEDDWYEGMFIPKGTVCLVNLWQCHRDPTSYGPDAASFNPERFLDEQNRLIPGPVETRDDGHSSYGFGRRACVGKNAANDSPFIQMATVLWAVQLECARDESGKEIPVDLETNDYSGMIL